ncbi:hypothetical protein [Sorangium sp. So ce1078]|uniref:hypothetical protein n=1 Tax=Sorangium sp. So ce1078 TaxID=3133329 RepID=UPI003F5F3307
MALLTALVGVMGSACVVDRDSWADEEPTREAEQAFVSNYIPGTKLSCTVPALTATGWTWSTLTIGPDRRTCYVEFQTSRLDPASVNATRCTDLGPGIGCESLLSL